MGLKVDNPTTYRFNEDVASYFDVEIGEPIRDNDYDLLKKEIYNLDIDYEEKANIINNINKLNTTTSLKEKKDLIKQIENFRKIHKI